MAKELNKKIVFEDGTEFYGYGFGGNDEKVCEIIFNTSMVGYQEVIANPVYSNKIMLMTYPLIGNCGIVDEDSEANNPTIGGLIVREYNDKPSNFRYSKTLAELLEENNIPAIEGIDTRKMFKKIREEGLGKVIITNADTPNAKAVETIKNTELEDNLAKKIICKKRWYARTARHQYNVVAIDCGLKNAEIQSLNNRGCNVTIMPWTVSDEEIKSLNPEGLYITNGPGKAEEADLVVALIKRFIGKLPISGVGLGCEIICTACGAKIEKMKLGHHGCNHPVMNLTNGKIETAVQSHSYVVNEQSLKNTDLKVTHINLLDKTVEGVASDKDKILGVEFQPASFADGLETNMYDQFVNLMKGGK